ncbi:putative histidine kinase [Methanocella paludicola SANAE]|uniref:histidine kinase n=1 Tax=Methanocella paludicola (strain DSM 17711 / JCM 13418 / NBRC 101707 / SANAE) TaxID=304371 RepID=D1Z0P9_METPS|nr:putative histidine kinase [Methanocella paludicola SANAE]
MVILSPYRSKKKDEDKTKAQLIEELEQLRERIKELKDSDNGSEQISSGNIAGYNDQSLFKTVIENTPMVAIQGYDRGGVIYHWNRASEYIYGYSAEEAIGKRIQDLIVIDEDVEAFERTVRDISETGKPTQCSLWKLKARNGDMVWTYSSMFPVIEHDRVAEIFCMDVDVTRSKKMEESLREQEEQLRTLINAMPDIVCFKDGEGRWLEANAFDLRLFDIENVPYKGKTDSELAEHSGFYRDAFLMCEETDEKAWRAGATGHEEETIPKPDGSVMTFDTIKVPLFYPDGRRKGLVVIGRDITDRKRAEEQLKSAYEDLEKRVEERTGELARARNTLKAMLDTLPIGIVMSEAGTERITYFSPGALKILGGHIMAASQDMEPGPYDFFEVDGSPLPVGERPLQRSLRTGAYVQNVEVIVRRKDGSTVTALISSAPVKDANGNIIAAVSSISDVTELRRADKALKENERFLENVFEGIQDGISILDKDMNILRVNHAMKKWYPDMVPLEGKKCYQAYHKRTIHCEKCPTIKAIKTRALQSDVVPIAREDGSTGWLELYAFPLTDRAGNVTSIIEHVRDITSRKQAEEQLVEAKAQAELYLDLMGHDINNMNQIALGFLELALGTLDLNKEEKQLISKPLEAIESSTRLIDNVRKLQKVKEGGLKLHDIDVGEMVRKIIPRYSDIVGRDITIDFTAGCECNVKANDLLDDVYANVIGNAIKHSTGRLAIDIHLDRVKIGERDYCMVTVEDDGPGIPDERKARLFSRSLKRTSGKGLGLYLIKMLAEDFHGKVWVEDRVPGDHTKGARFMIMLPAIEK